MNKFDQQIVPAWLNEKNSRELFKNLLKANNEELNQQFQPNKSVATLLANKAKFIDAILSACWQHFMAGMEDDLSLIAVGGYGRGELFPHSDVDILVLMENNHEHDFHSALSDFNTFLWDIGLKPGLSTRSLDECIEAATEDQTVFTTLLEMRLIDGNTTVFEALKRKIRSNGLWPSEKYFTAKLEEQRQRYKKFHDTAYNLEPNVKESPGGLRDRHVIAWVFKRHYQSDTLKELIKYGFITDQEYDELLEAQEKLWQIRYALHVLTDRREDRLLFDYQRELAVWFGFPDTGNNECIEQFMQHYFKTVQGLERLNEILLQVFKEQLIDPNSAKAIQEIDENFNAVAGFIETKHDKVFVNDPLALLKVFLVQQKHPELKGIRATTIREIRKNLDLIDDDFRNNPDARQLFIEIFRQPHGITHALRWMNRFGVLAEYLPSFANIVARMQYDLFHIYTVDEHTLFVIRNLRRFALDEHNEELPFCNMVFFRINKPEILFLAALFHDIAKGKGGDHSTLGEEIARDFCTQHLLSKHDTELIAWLVKNHLLMSMTAQRKDISDPDEVFEFAKLVGNTEYLNHLYLLTVADIRATSPKLWNSWKDSLLRELYISTHKTLRLGLQAPSDLQERIKETQLEARKILQKQGISDQTIDRVWEHFKDDYFLRYYPDEIVCHTTAIASSTEQDLPLVLLRPQTQRGSAEIFIYAKDQPGIFADCTNILDQLGLTILDARIVSTKDFFTLNSFQVLEQSGKPIKDLYRELNIISAIRKNLLDGKTSFSTNFFKLSRQAKNFPIKTQINFHQDNQHHCTILELVTTDRPGLLSRVSKVLLEHDVHLNSARITTIGSRVEDMFYITDEKLQPITNQDQLNNIKTSILGYLKTEEPGKNEPQSQ